MCEYMCLWCGIAIAHLIIMDIISDTLLLSTWKILLNEKRKVFRQHNFYIVGRRKLQTEDGMVRVMMCVNVVFVNVTIVCRNVTFAFALQQYARKNQSSNFTIEWFVKHPSESVDFVYSMKYHRVYLRLKLFQFPAQIKAKSTYFQFKYRISE